MSSSANLGPHLEKYVYDLVRDGRYGSRSEVLREGVRLVEEREKRLAALDAALARGVADAEGGHTKPIKEVKKRLTSKYESAAEKGTTPSSEF